MREDQRDLLRTIGHILAVTTDNPEFRQRLYRELDIENEMQSKTFCDKATRPYNAG